LIHSPRHKLLQVGLPDVLDVRVLEQHHAPLINLERVLEELVLLTVKKSRYAERPHDCYVYVREKEKEKEKEKRIRTHKPQPQQQQCVVEDDLYI
jgi:hypothetical protein